MNFINSTNKAQFRYARALTAHYAKSFYLSAALLPQGKRWATYALYGFCRYVDNLIDTPRPRSEQERIQEIDYLENEINISYHSKSFKNGLIISSLTLILALIYSIYFLITSKINKKEVED